VGIGAFPAESCNVGEEVAVPGRIRDEDVALVRERVSLDDVVADHVQLRNAGGGRLKGLCPFHDEKTPSFQVNRDLGLYKCWGCGVSGDVITFVREMEHLDFSDAVEMLARRAGIEIHREQGGAAPGQSSGQRQRLLDAHDAAAEFFRAQLHAPEGEIGRTFLAERGFDEQAWAHFGVGYAPAGWDTTLKHLRQKGFRDPELLAAGIASQGQRGPIDRFRGRLIWPIRDRKGDVIGFGARRLREDDSGPKYLNTPETALYKKSQVLYGVDLAKGEIARSLKAVVVEGYTDVMACHLAGERTAVATCGTAFGDEHIQILRRLLMDQDELRGRVIFTFDGDEAGRNAALKAFAGEQKFVTQTFVAVQPDGLDPCELRQQRGDAAVRDLIASHIPLAEFAIRATLEKFDLSIPEGRVEALTATAPVVATLKDASLRDEYARRLAGWLGMEVEPVLQRVRQGGGRAAGQDSAPARRAAPTARPDPRDPGLVIEREAAKLAIQRPVLAGPVFDGLGEECFTARAYAAIRTAIAKAGGVTSTTGGPEWVAKVRDGAETDSVRDLVTELAVEPLQTRDDEDVRYGQDLLVRLEEMALTRRIQDLKSRLQRVNPVTDAGDYNRMFGELIAMEEHKIGLRDQAVGSAS